MSTPDEVQATERRLKELIQEHALTPWAGAMLWVACHAYAKARVHAERDRLLSERDTGATDAAPLA
jgi:hypothetical protein